MSRGKEVLVSRITHRYGVKGGRRSQYVGHEFDRPFIAWDGEGQNLLGLDKPQSLVLFGSSAGKPLVSDRHLSCGDLCEFIANTGEENPHARHVAYAFDYDANMIMQSLWRGQLEKVRESNKIWFRHNDERYMIEYIKRKWFQVTRLSEDRHNNTTVRIEDMFTFHHSSFVKACHDSLGCQKPILRDLGTPECRYDCVPDLADIYDGKRHRGGSGNCELCGNNPCPFDRIAYVQSYWEREIAMLAKLATKNRKDYWGAGLEVKKFYGPACLSRYAMRKHNVKQAMHDTRDNNKLWGASMFAYMGGRFELFKVGYLKGPLYVYDLNSAYPYYTQFLPNLATGEWRRVDEPTEIEPFGVYHIEFLAREDMAQFMKARWPNPLFARNKRGFVSFPRNTVEGWFWSPEAAIVVDNPRTTIKKGYVFDSDGSRPMEWVKDYYYERKKMQAVRNASEKALKLCINSTYGIMAQRSGWHAETPDKIPTYHQLEWAGWITSSTRAALFGAHLHLKDYQNLVAFETDSIMTQEPIPLPLSDNLGDWKLTVYDEGYYLQSGLGWFRKGDVWEVKRRGLDPESFRLEDCRKYVESLNPGEEWDPYVGTTSRFVGLGQALASKRPLRDRHCVWDTSEKIIHVGIIGKRAHRRKDCHECIHGIRPSEQAHWMDAGFSSAWRNSPHHIPWFNLPGADNDEDAFDTFAIDDERGLSDVDRMDDIL